MNAPIKTFALATAASMVFLACNDIGTNVDSGNPCKVKVLSKTCNDERCWYDESDSSYFSPHDPNWFRIEDSVKEWMEEQFATESDSTRLFIISDFFIHENYVNTLDISGQTESEYYIDGKRVNREEFDNAVAKMQEYRQERAAKGKRNLPIPEAMYETDISWFGVPMTAKEIAELTENYKEIEIEFYMEPIYEVEADLQSPTCY